MQSANIFSHSIAYLLILLTESFTEQKLLIFRKSNLSTSLFMEIMLWVSSIRTPCQALNHEYFLIFFPRNFRFCVFHWNLWFILHEVRHGTYVKVFGFYLCVCMFACFANGCWVSQLHLLKSLSLLNWTTFAHLSKVAWASLGLFLGSPLCSIDLCPPPWPHSLN